MGAGYVRPIYLLPMFQKKIAYKGSFPFSGNENYAKGSCPVVEDLHYSSLWTHGFTKSSLSLDDIQDVVNAYDKVCQNISELVE